MKTIHFCLLLFVASVLPVLGQITEPTKERQRVVVSENVPKPAPSTTPLPKPAISTAHSMSFRQIKSRIAEARRALQTKMLATAASDATTGQVESVRVAFLDRRSDAIDFLVLPKESFLSTVSEEEIVSESGRRMRVRTIRGNGVNTPVILIDENEQTHPALMVQYPVIRNGKFIEMAYYMSTHPGLVTPEVVNAGRFYVRNVIDTRP